MTMAATSRLEYGPRTAVEWLGVGVKRQRGVPASYSLPAASPARPPPDYLTLQVRVKDDRKHKHCPCPPAERGRGVPGAPQGRAAGHPRGGGPPCLGWPGTRLDHCGVTLHTLMLWHSGSFYSIQTAM